VLLEIGVWYGGSIVLWSKYFPKGTIYGMDTEDASQGDVKNLSNVKLIFANAYVPGSLNLVPQCDIIIDDGPHTFMSQVFLIRNYTSKLKPGGVMVIEDVASKWADELASLAKEIGFPDANVIRKNDPGDTLVVIRK
jgi:precorrin-6B methylase 2